MKPTERFQKWLEKREYRRRLRRLIKIMHAKGDNIEHFNMLVWLDIPYEARLHLKQGEELPLKTLYGCGTLACALGTAAFDPVLRKAGLTVRWTATGAEISYQHLGGTLRPAASFFGLSHEDADALFNSNDSITQVTPRAWAQFAKFLLESRGYL